MIRTSAIALVAGMALAMPLSAQQVPDDLTTMPAVSAVPHMARAATAFVGLYTIPAVKHDVPASTRLEPAY